MPVALIQNRLECDNTFQNQFGVNIYRKIVSIYNNGNEAKCQTKGSKTDSLFSFYFVRNALKNITLLRRS